MDTHPERQRVSTATCDYMQVAYSLAKEYGSCEIVDETGALCGVLSIPQTKLEVLGEDDGLHAKLEVERQARVQLEEALIAERGLTQYLEQKLVELKQEIARLEVTVKSLNYERH